MIVPLLLLVLSALAYIADTLIEVEALGAIVPEVGEMSNHSADGSAVKDMGVLPAWSVHAGACGSPRQVRQV